MHGIEKKRWFGRSVPALLKHVKQSNPGTKRENDKEQAI